MYFFDLKRIRNTRDTIYAHFQGISNNIYGFERPTRPYSFLPVQMTDGRVSA